VRTAMTARHYLLPDGSLDEKARAAAEKPLRRMSPLGLIGDPEDIAYAIHYLVSDAARFVTGQILRPNGGVAMPW
jgi:3-oxoacyl-[acyl-carrier protein] reductase